MRKLFIVTIAALSTIACTKKSGTSTATSLNSTETQLLGTWYQTKEDDHTINGYSPITYKDTTYTYPSKEGYIQLTSDIYSTIAPTNYKKCQYALGMSGVITGASALQYWFYEPSTSLLSLATVQYSIISLTSTDLIIKNTGGYGTRTIYLHK